MVGVGIGGYAVLIAATLLQTYGGRAPLDPGPGVILLALVGVALLAASWLVAARRLGSALHRSPEPSHGT